MRYILLSSAWPLNTYVYLFLPVKHANLSDMEHKITPSTPSFKYVAYYQTLRHTGCLDIDSACTYRPKVNQLIFPISCAVNYEYFNRTTIVAWRKCLDNCGNFFLH